MSKSFQEMAEFHGFQPILTADGSPSLITAETNEAMHNRAGALSETLEIYLPVFEKVHAHGLKIQALSVGFGLGYVETILAGWSLTNNVEVERLHSYEKVPGLYESFNQFLQSDQEKPDSLHLLIFSAVAKHFGRTIDEVRKQLKYWLESGSWRQNSNISQAEFHDRFNSIVYDPFSSKTNEGLWSEEYLQEFLELAAAPSCVLSTYAAKGTLRRTLIENGFQVEKVPGFSGKRERIFATRGLN